MYHHGVAVNFETVSSVAHALLVNFFTRTIRRKDRELVNLAGCKYDRAAVLEPMAGNRTMVYERNLCYSTSRIAVLQRAEGVNLPLHSRDPPPQQRQWQPY